MIWGCIWRSTLQEAMLCPLPDSVFICSWGLFFRHTRRDQKRLVQVVLCRSIWDYVLSLDCFISMVRKKESIDGSRPSNEWSMVFGSRAPPWINISFHSRSPCWRPKLFEANDWFQISPAKMPYVFLAERRARTTQVALKCWANSRVSKSVIGSGC